MSAPRPIAIGLPVYNGEKYLGQSIESILGQTFGDFTLLISDNFSTDGTWEICNRYAILDRRIQLRQNSKNLGVILNSRRVFEETRSEFFMWHAHDDLLGSNYLLKCYQVLVFHREYVACGTKQTLIDRKGRESRSISIDENRHEEDPAERLSNHFLNGAPVLFFNSLIRRDALQKVFRMMYGVETGDAVLIMGLLILGKFHQIQEVLRYRRLHEDEIPRTISYVRNFRRQGLLGKLKPDSILPHLCSHFRMVHQFRKAKLLDPNDLARCLEVITDNRSYKTALRADISFNVELLCYYVPKFNEVLSFPASKRMADSLRNRLK